ncbi:MAG: hypothetical protein ACR2FY_07985 [Pirellulaceae bacterium]
MGEENRGSSGSGTVMIVVAILGGILLLGCCGGVLVLGAGMFYVGSEVQDAQMQLEETIRKEGEVVPEIQESLEPLRVMPDEPPAPTEPRDETPAPAREENKE